MKDLMFLHGFASDSNAHKANFLSEKLANYPEVRFHRPNFNPSAEDFRYKTITGMIARLSEYILANQIERPYFIASSLSGIVALNYANRYEHVAALLLVSPMTKYMQLHSDQEEEAWKAQRQMRIYTKFAENTYLAYDFAIDAQNYTQFIAPPNNTKIIHGKYDETVPFAESVKYSNEYRLELIAVRDIHSLSKPSSLDKIWLECRTLFALDEL